MTELEQSPLLHLLLQLHLLQILLQLHLLLLLLLLLQRWARDPPAMAITPSLTSSTA